MRILLTTAPRCGAPVPVPLAWALRSAGHDVLLATTWPGARLGPAAGLATVDAAPGVIVAGTLHDAVAGLADEIAALRRRRPSRPS